MQEMGGIACSRKVKGFVQGGGCAFAHFVLLGVPDWLLELKCLCKNTVSNKMQKKI
jgi:hypothetical protein